MANQINLDRSQRVDITCKRGDTFNLNLELKDDSNVALVLGNAQDSSLTDYYFYKMEVREADTDQTDGSGGSPGYVLQMNGTVSTTSNGLVTFTQAHDLMTGSTVPAGIYVYDIQQKIVSDLGDDGAEGGTGVNADTIDSVETLLYGIFKIVEDVTVAV
jgi:hypothetical protein